MQIVTGGRKQRVVFEGKQSTEFLRQDSKKAEGANSSSDLFMTT